MYDIIIIGGGPAGLTAALYGARANKNILVLEKASFGGQITFSPKVENIPGFIELSGNEFAEKLVDQVINQGVEFDSCEVLEIKDGEVKTVITDSGEYESKAVIIATGAKHRLLGLDREQELIGNGISFCAVCDGAFFSGKNVAVIGGGNSALQEAVLLSDVVNHVFVVQNLSQLTGEAKLQNQLEKKNNVTVITDSVVDSLEGENELTAINIKNTVDGTVKNLQLDGMFIAIGLVPQNEAFSNVLELDKYGYGVASEDCKTKTPGIFIAGDCRNKRIRQVTTAASDGATAALAACDYIDNM